MNPVFTGNTQTYPQPLSLPIRRTRSHQYIIYIYALIGLLCASHWEQALSATKNQVYISDELTVPLRTGPSNRHRILSFLKSGTALVIIPSPQDATSQDTISPEDDWAYVANEATQRQGWIKRQHLSTEPTAAILLEKKAKAYAKLKELKQQNATEIDSLKRELAATQATLKQTEATLKETQTQFETLQKLSANTVSLDKRNQELSEELTMLEVTAQQLQMENRDLQRDTRREGIFQGMLAVITGVILAIILPRIHQRRRRSDW